MNVRVSDSHNSDIITFKIISFLFIKKNREELCSPYIDKLRYFFFQVGAQSIGRNHVTITWVPPIDDGGSKVTGYIVEQREYGSSLWLTVSDYNIVTPEFTVPNLKEFHDYEFRVVAVNKSGR